VMVFCTFGKMNKGSTTEERKEFNITEDRVFVV
jgi:hypothetical protein